MTRAFSNKSENNDQFKRVFLTEVFDLQDSISAPASLPMGPKWIRINLPNREELSLRVVFAFPNASRMGFVWTI